MTATEVLVVILSIFLAVFLVVGIILGILLIKVTKQIKQVTSTAEQTVGDIGRTVAGLNKVASPALLAKFIVGQVAKRRKGKK